MNLEEDAVVQLAEAEELEDLARLRGKLVDTDDTHAEDELRLGLNEELSLHLRLAAHRDELFRPMLVLTVVITSSSTPQKSSNFKLKTARSRLYHNEYRTHFSAFSSPAQLF